MLYAALYFSTGFLITLRMAYLAGRHYTVHRQNGDQLYDDKSGLHCKNFYCDGPMPMGIAYIFMTLFYPVFLPILLLAKVVLTFEGLGAGSALPPENSDPRGKVVE